MNETLQFFDLLTSDDVNWILDQCESRTVLAERVLIAAGSRTSHLYFVSQGQFDVFVPGLSGSVNRLQRGALIGEVSWIERTTATATVRARESSEVLALSVNELDEKLRSSPEMAARFYAALARIVAARLRRATAQIASGREAASLDSLPGGLGAQLADFKAAVLQADRRLLEAPGDSEVVAEDLLPRYEKLWRTFDTVVRELPDDDSRELLGSIAQRELLPYVLMSGLAERAYSKPRGYAGDFLTIEWMYENAPRGTGRLGPILDRGSLDMPSVRAARNRRGLLAGLIADSLDRVPDRAVHITSLACGPAREIFDVFAGTRAQEARARLFVTALDIDQEALALLDKRIRETGLHQNISTVHANLIHVSSGRQIVEQVPQDFIYSIGLIDYFADGFVINLMDWTYGQLRIGGKLVLGNFAPENPTKAFMDYVLDWRLIHRTPADMDRLYQSSRFARATSRVLFEEQGINLFAECVKERA